MTKIRSNKMEKQISRRCSLMIMVVTLAVILFGLFSGLAFRPANAAVTATEQTAEGPRDPSRLTYPRLYCTPDGNSHWESVTVELRKINFAPPAASIYIGDKFPASSAFFGGFEARWGAHDLETRLYHPAPTAQFAIILGGVFSITTTDGETRRFRPGDVLRLEDTPPCKGHITVVGDKPGFLMFAP